MGGLLLKTTEQGTFASRVLSCQADNCLFPCAFPEIDFGLFFFLRFYLSIHEKRRQKHRQREKQAPHREPDGGLDPRTPGSRAKDRRLTAQPPRCPNFGLFKGREASLFNSAHSGFNRVPGR